MRTVIVIDAAGTAQTYMLEDSPTILTAFEDAGFHYPHGCRIGCCGACASEVIEGHDNLPPMDNREAERMQEFRIQEKTSGGSQLVGHTVRLMCRTALTADITIRPLSGVVVALVPDNIKP